MPHRSIIAVSAATLAGGVLMGALVGVSFAKKPVAYEVPEACVRAMDEADQLFAVTDEVLLTYDKMVGLYAQLPMLAASHSTAEGDALIVELNALDDSVDDEWILAKLDVVATERGSCAGGVPR